MTHISNLKALWKLLMSIRDHKVILKIRRRRWTDLRTGKSFSIPIDLDVVIFQWRHP